MGNCREAARVRFGHDYHDRSSNSFRNSGVSATDMEAPNPAPAPPLQRLIDLCIRHRMLLLLFVAIAVAVCFEPASRLSFDQSIESLYAKNNPHLRDYLKSKRWFGGDELVILAYRDPELLEETGLSRLQSFAHELSDVKGIAEVQDHATITRVSRLLFLNQDDVREFNRGILLGEDGETTAIILRLKPVTEVEQPRTEIIANIRKMAAEFPFDVHIVGEPVQVQDMFRYVEEDGETLGLWSSVLLVGVILVFFRSLRWVVLPLLVVHITLIWTKAILVLSGMRLSMVSSMLTSLITIIGVATTIHITVHYRQWREKLDRIEALRQTLYELAPAIFWTCATTAVGFAALLSSHITPVQSFGIMMALGSMLVLVAAATLLPGGILIGSLDADPQHAPAEKRLASALESVTNVIERRPRMLAIGTAVLTLIALFGFTHLRVETDFSKNFRRESRIVQDLNFIETHLGGSGAWEVNFPAPHDEEALDEEYFDRVRSVTEKIRNLKVSDHRAVTKAVALPDLFDILPDKILFQPISLSQQRKLMQRLQPGIEKSLYNPEAGRMRIMLRAKERQQSEAKLKAMNQIRGIVAEEFGEGTTTGLFVLLTYIIESLLSDQITSFVLAAIGITAMASIAFRSLKIGLICLVPNVFPIVMVIGLMGWTGLPINIATAMIASVSMGLTVDSSIHYVSGYRRARARGLGFHAALQATHQGVGKALVFANIALILGFTVLMLSHFIPLVYFGMLVSVAMLGGLIGNLVLLPLLLHWAEGDGETAA